MASRPSTPARRRPGDPVPTSGSALVALVVALGSALTVFLPPLSGLLGVLTIVLGLASRRRIRRAHEGGLGIALAATLIGVLTTATAVFAWGVPLLLELLG